MPKNGYMAVTIGEDIYEKIKKDIQRINQDTGVKRFRSVSHFVEEATASYMVNGIKEGSENPEQIMQKVIEVVWNRRALLKAVFKRLTDLPIGEAREMMQQTLTKAELEYLKRIFCIEGTKR